MANIVAIVGRPNVGKSTLFNRLIGERKAIMDNESGITRDRHYGRSHWTGKNFTVIDTGGYVTNSDDVFEEAIRDQVQLAIDEATVILFVVDIDAGLTGLDKEFASVLRQSDKPVYVVANKADEAIKHQYIGEFYGMGYDLVYPVSGMTGSGTGELLDDVCQHFEDDDTEDPFEGIPKLAIIGRPNAGKSSFVNALLGTERNIVTDQAGTTRDSIHTLYNKFNKEFVLVDTAGVRKKSKVHEDVEFYSVMRALRSIENSDVCVLMIDAERGVESQDLNLITLAQKNNKGIVILINKWDLIEKDHHTAKVYEEEILNKIAPATYIPIVFISVTDKQRIHKAIEKAIEVAENRTRKITTSKLNDFILPEIEKNNPPALKGKYIRIKYATQLPIHYPAFAFFCNLPQYIRESYTRYLEKRIRSEFNYEGVPISIMYRKK